MDISGIVLIVGIIAFMLIVFIVDLKLLYYFEHGDDKDLNSQLFAKLSVMLGLQLGWLMILLLPIDAYNRHPPNATQLDEVGDLNMQVFWYCIWWLVSLYLVLLLPFSIFFYESEDDPRISRQKPWKRALVYSILTLVICAIIVGLLYIFLRTTTVSVTHIECANWGLPSKSIPPSTVLSSGEFDAINNACAAITLNPTATTQNKPITIGFSTYLIGLMGFVGWWFFVLFGGIGLTALPLDLILAFVDRPTPIDLSLYGDRKRFLGEKARALKLIGESLKRQESDLEGGSAWKHRKLRMLLRTDMNKYRQAVFVMENEYKCLNISLNERGENPFYSYLKLIIGIICCILTVSWIVHIIMYIVIPQILHVSVTGGNYNHLRFLDGLLEAVSRSSLGILAILIYGLLLVYLLMCTIKGCFKFGMRIFCCFPIHPMKKEDTHLNSFLFNVAMILVAASAVVQFSQQAFRGYASQTAATWIFEVQLHAIKFFGFFFSYNIFVYLLLFWALVAAIYLAIRPRDRVKGDINDFQMLPAHMQLQVEQELHTLKDPRRTGHSSKQLKERWQRDPSSRRHPPPH